MYCMVLSGTDTTQVILSDWRNTGSRSEKWRCSAKVAGYWVIPNGNILGLAMRIHLSMHIIRMNRIFCICRNIWRMCIMRRIFYNRMANPTVYYNSSTTSSQVPHPTQEVKFMAVGEPDYTTSNHMPWLIDWWELGLAMRLWIHAVHAQRSHLAKFSFANMLYSKSNFLAMMVREAIPHQLCSF